MSLPDPQDVKEIFGIYLPTAWKWLKIVFQWSGWGVVGFLLFYIYKHDEKLDRWLARIDRFLLWMGFRRDKKFIERDLQGKINSASKKINKEAEGIISKGVKIVWVNEDTIESFLRKGVVIIRMKHYKNQDKNTVRAACHYVSTGVLHTAKKYLPDIIRQAVNLGLVKKILSEERELGTSTDYFFENVLNPIFRGNKELEKTFSLIEVMENKGLFTRILLREIKWLGKKVHPTKPTRSILNETKDFFYFLKPFAELERGDFIKEWSFIRNNICVGILYVAKVGKIDIYGLKPYKKRIKEKIERGAKNIYIFARRDNNINAATKIVEAINKETRKIEKIRIEKYKTFLDEKRVPAICVVLAIKQ